MTAAARHRAGAPSLHGVTLSGCESAKSSERGPWDRWPFAAWPRQPASTEQQVCAVYQRRDLSITEQRAELFGRFVPSFRTAASSGRFSSEPAHPHNSVRSL